MIKTLIGDNAFMLASLRRKIIAEFIASFGDFSLEIIDAEETDPSKIYDSLSNLPFLSSKKLIVIDNPSKNKALINDLPEWLDNLGDYIDVLITDPSVDKRTTWFKYLSKKTDLVDCRVLEKHELKKWVNEYLDHKDGKIDDQAIERLLLLVGNNQMQLSNELDKLINFNPQITIDNINLLVDQMPQDTVFDMLDALAAGQNERVNFLFEELQKTGVHSAEILAMINWQLITLALIKSVGSGDISQKTGLHRFVVQKNSQLANRLSLAKLESMIKVSIETELKIKQQGVNDTKAVGMMISQMQLAYR